MARRRSLNKSSDASQMLEEMQSMQEEIDNLHKEIEELHETIGLSSLLTKAMLDALISKRIVDQAEIEKHMGQMVSVLEPCQYKDQENVCDWDWSGGPCPRGYTEDTAENCEALPGSYAQAENQGDAGLIQVPGTDEGEESSILELPTGARDN